MKLRFPDREMEPCRVFCIGCNYAEHIKELGSTDDDRCILFMKPATSLVASGEAVRIPRDRGPVHHEVELVVAVGRGGREIPADRALEHVAGATLGLDLTLRERQGKLKKLGQPWEVCKAFDNSGPVGDFTPCGPDLDLAAVEMRCRVNGELRTHGNTRDMLFSVDRLIAIISRTWELREGDVVFTGTPPGVGPVEPGDTIAVESPQLGRFAWEIV
jgi:2-keto-4-pentenoate hydratase/2-oxohepta-3-ene-1,7-dioic acid hydratase in catechol pathway